MTDDERRAFYGSMDKADLVEMLVDRDMADSLILYGVSGGTTIPRSGQMEKTTVSATIKNFTFNSNQIEEKK
jgi:hypothetical protein